MCLCLRPLPCIRSILSLSICVFFLLFPPSRYSLFSSCSFRRKIAGLLLFFSVNDHVRTYVMLQILISIQNYQHTCTLAIVLSFPSFSPSAIHVFVIKLSIISGPISIKYFVSTYSRKMKRLFAKSKTGKKNKFRTKSQNFFSFALLR